MDKLEAELIREEKQKKRRRVRRLGCLLFLAGCDVNALTGLQKHETQYIAEIM